MSGSERPSIGLTGLVAWNGVMSVSCNRRVEMKAMFSEVTQSGANKVKRYGWVVKNDPGVLMMIHKSELRINDEYQRAAVVQKITEITSNLSWVAFGVLIVAERDGEYWVVDGQHRYLAACRRSDISELPCIVFRTESVKQEAQGFIDCNTLRKVVSTLGKHKAMIVAGDNTAIFVQSVFDELGVKPTSTRKTKGEVCCVKLCYNLAKESPIDFRNVLMIANNIAIADDEGVDEKVLGGLWYLNKNTENGLADARLRKRIHDKGHRALLKGAREAQAFFGVGTKKNWAVGILQVLNHGLQKKFALITSSKE